MLCRPYASPVTDQGEFKHKLIDLQRQADAQEVVYALRIRGIESEAVRASSVPLVGGYCVMLYEWNIEQAKAVLPVILDAMLPQIADNGNGGCFYCGYSLLGTMAHTDRCPECGTNLRSIKARFAARSDKKSKD